jgi:hypothetical protein
MSRDELSELWHSEIPSLIEKEDEKMLTMVIEKTRSFDRLIAGRNMREYMAALFVLPWAVWGAWTAPSLLMRAGFVLLILTLLGFVYYLRRFGGTRRLDPGARLNAYSQLLRANYDQQIRVVRSVKYVLLPMYAGILMVNVGRLRVHAEGWGPRGVLIYLAVAACFFVLIWILNEVYAVRRLERAKCKVPSIEGSES